MENVGDEIIGLNLLPPPQLGGRRKSGKHGKKFFVFFRVERNHSDFFNGVSLTGGGASLASDGVCKQHTAPRASFTCHTQFFSCARGSNSGAYTLDRIVGLLFLRLLKSHFISPVFHRTLLDSQLSPHFSTPFSSTCTWFAYLSFVVISFDVSIHCHSARRVMLWPTG